MYVSNEEMVVLRKKLAAEGKLTGWDMQKRPVQAGYPPHYVSEHCVNNADWQALRLRMKGKATHEKLAMCERWWDLRINAHPYSTEVQVGNYLGALRRGGQLDMNNQIRKYR